ncbi:ATP-dependent helicase, partial [Xylella fastidiosa subsp. multiplex]|uniref:3'-5' exonuclease n=1 Tax=Xylella fastidiosa TaxID=2371 RepID=UPI0013296CBC
GGITLSTAHKSKGLQWPRVMILDYNKFKIITKKSTKDQIQQEYNLDYGAGTRAEHELILQNKKDKKEE